MALNRINGIIQRHQMPGWKALTYEAFLRLYQRAPFRRVARIPFPTREPRGWVFLVGCYNAGTTVIKNGLALHPEFSSAPIEADQLTGGLSGFEHGGWPRGMYANASAILDHRKSGNLNRKEILRDWAPWLRRDRIFLEKSISHSVRMKLLRETFPGSRFICIVREPMAVLRGIRKRSRPASGGEYSNQFLERQYQFIYEHILKDSHSEDTTFVGYEDFVSRPDQELSRLFQWLGVAVQEILNIDHVLHVGGRTLEVRKPTNPSAGHLSAKEQLLQHLASISSHLVSNP